RRADGERGHTRGGGETGEGGRDGGGVERGGRDVDRVRRPVYRQVPVVALVHGAAENDLGDLRRGGRRAAERRDRRGGRAADDRELTAGDVGDEEPVEPELRAERVGDRIRRVAGGDRVRLLRPADRQRPDVVRGRGRALRR